MNNEIIVRAIKHDELRELLDLYKYLNEEDPILEDTEPLQELWDSIYNDPNLHYIVAEKNEIMVSTCNISIIKNLTRNARPYGLIENVVTHPKYRNLGLGKIVLNKAIEIAKENNSYKVMLLTSSKDISILKFYKSIGFRDDIKTGFAIKL